MTDIRTMIEAMENQEFHPPSDIDALKTMVERIEDLIRICGQAQFDDCEATFPVYVNDEVVGGNGANSFEAGFALDSVAQILGLETTATVHDRLCEGEGNPE